ncbi:hypothetical protein [Aquimarina rhabdastrellae]
MKKQLIVFLLACFTVIQYSSGQKVKGNPKALKEVKAYKVIFDYTDIKVGKFKTEEDFLKDKMKKREEKEKGLGEKFKKSWFDDRETRFKPKYIESFNKRFEDGELAVNENDEEYIMKIHSTWVYPGYNVGIVRHNAELTATVSVYKASEPDNEILSLTYKKIQGKGAFGNDYNSGYRISECYAKLAKSVAKYFKKKVIK